MLQYISVTDRLWTDRELVKGPVRAFKYSVLELFCYCYTVAED